MLFDIERKLFLLQLSEEKSALASSSHHPGYRQITEIPCFGLLEAGTSVDDVLRSFGCYERISYRQLTCFRQSGSKNDKPHSGRPRITTSLEVRLIVTSKRRYRFMTDLDMQQVREVPSILPEIV